MFVVWFDVLWWFTHRVWSEDNIVNTPGFGLIRDESWSVITLTVFLSSFWEEGQRGCSEGHLLGRVGDAEQ